MELIRERDANATFEFSLFFPTDSDYENANRSADVDVELMAFQSIIGDDYKGHDLSVFHKHA